MKTFPITTDRPFNFYYIILRHEPDSSPFTFLNLLLLLLRAGEKKWGLLGFCSPTAYHRAESRNKKSAKNFLRHDTCRRSWSLTTVWFLLDFFLSFFSSFAKITRRPSEQASDEKRWKSKHQKLLAKHFLRFHKFARDGECGSVWARCLPRNHFLLKRAGNWNQLSTTRTSCLLGRDRRLSHETWKILLLCKPKRINFHRGVDYENQNCITREWEIEVERTKSPAHECKPTWSRAWFVVHSSDNTKCARNYFDFFPFPSAKECSLPSAYYVGRVYVKKHKRRKFQHFFFEIPPLALELPESRSKENHE